MGWLFLTHCYPPQRVTTQQDMCLQTSFDILSRIVDQYESNGRTVRHVEATTSEADEGALHVAMDLPVSLCSSNGRDSSLILEAATLTDGDGLQVEFSTSVRPSLPSTAAAVSVSNQAVRVTDSGLLLTVELTIDPSDTHEPTGNTDTVPTGANENGNKNESRSQSELADLAAVRDESVPPYEDTEYLQQLYDSCDTFTEMSQTIEMNVTSETVRRYMIESSIHTPSTYNTSIEAEQADQATNEDAETKTEIESDMDMNADTDTDTDTDADTDTEAAKPASDQSLSVTDSMEPSPGEQLVTDGIGLPEGLQIADIMDAVTDSSTLYEVQRDLGLERQRTQELLQQLNLLDLVMGRLADNPERDVSYEEMATRIRQCTPSGA